MRMTFVFARPQAHFSTKVDQGLRLRASAAGMRPTRCDVDNVAKFVLDALSGWVFADDRQVMVMEARKRWARPGEEEGMVLRFAEAATDA